MGVQGEAAGLRKHFGTFEGAGNGCKDAVGLY